MRKIKFWLDSGANAFSCYEQELSFEDIGISEEEWDAMNDDEKDTFAREIAWERMDWGYQEIRDENEE